MIKILRIYSPLYLGLSYLLFLSIIAFGVLTIFPNLFFPAKAFHQTSLSQDLLGCIIVVCVAGLIPLNLWLTALRLHRWAESRNCTLIRARDCPVSDDPFGYGAWFSRYLKTYEVLVLDENGQEQKAWVRFGKFWHPSLHVEEIWEDDSPTESLLDKYKDTLNRE